MTQEQDPSVKEVLEDIKKVMSGASSSAAGPGILKSEIDDLAEEEPLDLLDEIEEDKEVQDVLKDIDKALGTVEVGGPQSANLALKEEVSKQEQSIPNSEAIPQKVDVSVGSEKPQDVSAPSSSEFEMRSDIFSEGLKDENLQNIESSAREKATIDSNDIEASTDKQKDIDIESSTTTEETKYVLSSADVGKSNDEHKKMDINMQPSIEEKKPAQPDADERSEEVLTSKESALSTAAEIKQLIGQIHKMRQHPGSSSLEHGITIEEMVISILKPELSKWLNQNLDKIVKEELVVAMVKSELSKWLNQKLAKMVKEVIEDEIKRIIDQNL